jgi:hypothetical protein
MCADQKTTGTVRSRESQNLSRNISGECPAWASWPLAVSCPACWPCGAGWRLLV